jgi:hypothetical protein
VLSTHDEAVARQFDAALAVENRGLRRMRQ